MGAKIAQIFIPENNYSKYHTIGEIWNNSNYLYIYEDEAFNPCSST